MAKVPFPRQSIPSPYVTHEQFGAVLLQLKADIRALHDKLDLIVALLKGGTGTLSKAPGVVENFPTPMGTGVRGRAQR